MKRLLLLLPLLVYGCKGQKGDTGPAGGSGTTGSSFIYKGSITSDNQFVHGLGTFDPTKGDISDVQVCTTPGGGSYCVQLGNVQVSTAAYCVLVPASVDIFNAQTQGYVSYAISVYQPANRG